MYSKVEGVAARFGLAFSAAAHDGLVRDAWCAICKVPPVEQTLYDPERIEAWVRDYGHLLGAVRHGARAVDPQDHPRPVVRLPLSETVRRCLCCESQLRPAVGLTDELLAAVRDGLTDPELFFVEDQLLFTICGVCATSEHGLREDGKSLLQRYIDVRCAGDFQIFRDSGYIDAATALAARINAAVKDLTV